MTYVKNFDTRKMHFGQNFIILAITTYLFLVPSRVKGKVLKMNISSSRYDQFERIHHDLTKIKIPKMFDAREKWHFCKSLRHIKNHGKCGASWAFVTSSLIADRLCIHSNGEIDVSMSEQDLMECCRSCYPEEKKYFGGCEGGGPVQAFRFWKQHGLVTGDNGCKPKSEGITEGIPVTECRLRCTNEKYPLKYKDDKKFGLRLFFQKSAEDPDIKHIFAEIMINGPVIGAMNSYEYVKDNPSPPKGIVVYNKSLIEIDEKPEEHAIKIIGWDEIDGIPVWTIAKSWGTDWCNNGFCYVKRGDFGIEKNIIITGLAGFQKINKKLEDDNHSKKNKTQTSGANFLKMTNFIKVLVILCISNI